MSAAVNATTVRQASGPTTNALTDEAYLARVRERLVRVLDPQVLDPFSPVPDRIDRISAVVHAHLAEAFPRAIPDPTLVQGLCDELAGLGPLQPLMTDPEVTDVLVNGPAEVWVERRGRLEATSVRFRNAQHLAALMEKIAALVGRHLSLESPCVDARMADGSRANLVIAPVGGPCLSIRKHRRVRLALRSEQREASGRIGSEEAPEDWVTAGGLSEAMAAFLATAVRARLNVLVAGATGAGKTTLLASLLAAVPSDRTRGDHRGHHRAGGARPGPHGPPAVRPWSARRRLPGPHGVGRRPSRELPAHAARSTGGGRDP